MNETGLPCATHLMGSLKELREHVQGQGDLSQDESRVGGVLDLLAHFRNRLMDLNIKALQPHIYNTTEAVSATLLLLLFII